MNRSPGVTAVAVVAILEGIFSCMMGFFALMQLVISRFVTQSSGAGPWPALQVLIFFGVGAFTIICAIGLQRLNNWARISLSVLGGVFAVMSLLGLIGAIFMAHLPTPSSPELPSNLMLAMAWVMGAISISVAGVGVWWLIFLNLRAVRDQFSSMQTAPALSQGVRIENGTTGIPISIAVIAWFMIASGALGVSLSLAMSFPTILFGVILKGWAAKLFGFLVGCAQLGLGIGLLRTRPRVLVLAVAFYVFHIVSAAVSWLLPGARVRFQNLAIEIMQRYHTDTTRVPSMSQFGMMFGLVFSIVYVGIPLWFLIARREAYLAAATRRKGEASTA